MATTLDQVIASLNSVYQPQVAAIEQRRASIPGQIAEQEKGLQAKQETAFGDILNGARRRGTGVAFGGIPLSEQARYTATEFLPALTNLRRAGVEQETSLADAINKIKADQFQQATGLYQFQQNYELQQQQMAEQRRQFDLQQKAAAKAAGAFNPTLGGAPGQAPGGAAPASPAAKTLSGGKSLQDAATALQGLLGTNNASIIRKTLVAIQSSAQRGNTYDQAKLQIINTRPEFQKYLSNFNGASF